MKQTFMSSENRTRLKFAVSQERRCLTMRGPSWVSVCMNDDIYNVHCYFPKRIMQAHMISNVELRILIERKELI